MTIGLIGRKCGMTRVFTDAGESVPVTVIEALPEPRHPGQGGGIRRLSRRAGRRLAAASPRASAGRWPATTPRPRSSRAASLVEFRLADGEGADLAPGAELKVDLFSAGQVVDVTGTTIGKGFAGTMKRHNFAGGMASHGASVVHRAPGSIGQRQTPGRVFPGKRMSGHMGAVRRTTENLRVVEIDAARNLLLIRGAVPGAPGGQVIVRPSVKAAVAQRDRSRRSRLGQGGCGQEVTGA